MRISDIGENGLVNIIRDRFSAVSDGLVEGIGDDAALIAFGDELLIVTTDLLVEDTHFNLEFTSLCDLGWKSVSASISDVAAMGGSPTYTFVSLGLPDSDLAVFEELYSGIFDICSVYNSAVAGGDTTRSERMVVNIVQLGVVNPEHAARRNGAQPEDSVIITGNIGESRAGLELLLDAGTTDARKTSEEIVMRHLRPTPRVREAKAAVATGRVHAMMDLSDGLAVDLVRMCHASNVGATVSSDRLPISTELEKVSCAVEIDPVELAASGGEDYELLIACDKNDSDAIISAIGAAGTPARVVGSFNDSQKILLRKPDGSEGNFPSAWEHF